MKFEYKDNHVFMTDYNSFDIEEILESGQCFTFEKIGDKHYTYTARGKIITIKQDMIEKVVDFYPCTKEDFENIWYNHFDLNTDYEEIKKILSKSDQHVKSAIEFAGGIRIMNQDFWNCLMAFIISQNNRIPTIKNAVRNISMKYGEKIEDDKYSFPAAQMLAGVKEDELKLCKTGFRAKYILDAVDKKLKGRLNDDDLKNMSTQDLKERLMEIYGVGVKVADCVLVFSLGRREVFPTDVWIKRIMQTLYFDNKETPIKDIHAFAAEKWGEYAGICQQYLFHYARLNKIGVKGE